MANFDWVSEVEEISAAALSVDVQSAPDLNTDDKLMQDTLMPRQNVDSVKLADLGSITFRPAADRRAWNQRGRHIPLKPPALRTFEMVPVEAYFTIGEREMQALRERFVGNRQLILGQIKADVPSRTRELAAANYRRIELDMFQAWVLGTITARDPQTGETYTVSYGFDSTRYETAGTAWNNAGVNAYDELVAWLGDAMAKVGSIAGVALGTAVLREIIKDAPTLAGGESMSLARLADRVSQDVQSPFRFYNMDLLPDIDVFTDGGIDTVATKRWPDPGVIAVVPADQRIGRMAYAPVGRAMDLGITVPDAKIDINGMAAFPETSNNGRELTVEVQANAFPLPNEKRISVMDTGI